MRVISRVVRVDRRADDGTIVRRVQAGKTATYVRVKKHKLLQGLLLVSVLDSDRFHSQRRRALIDMSFCVTFPCAYQGIRAFRSDCAYGDDYDVDYDGR